uniref:Major facilitator superfamily (MFS) profile domain-containing protein n=1 Tax=Ditylenchus dipsaci TaxID=166011 RepID=A0A915CTL1_9BILA
MIPTTTSSDSKSSSVEQRVPIGWKPVAPDGGYGWVVVFGAFLIHVFADGFVYSFGVIGQSLVDKYGYSNSEVSTILSLLSGLMYAIGIIAAVMCNKLGCRTTAVIGALLSAAGCGVSYFATHLIHLVFSIGVVMGAGLGLLYCPAIVIVTMYFEKNRSLATGITVCGSGVGTLGFAKLIAYFITLLEPDLLAIFPIYGGILLLCIPCGLLFKPVPLEPIYEEDDEELALKQRKLKFDQKEASCQLSFRQALFDLRKVPNFLCLCVRRLSNFLVTVGFNAAPMFLPMNAEAVLNKEKQQAANAVSFYGFANVLGRLFFGWICDRKLPFKWACLVFAMHNFIVYVAFCSFFGFMVSSYAALTSVLLVDLIGIDLMTTGLGLLLLFHGGACIAGPVIGGYLFDISKDYGWTFALIGGCLLVGGLILPATHLVPGRHIPVKEQPQTEENIVLMDSMPEKDLDMYIDNINVLHTV